MENLLLGLFLGSFFSSLMFFIPILNGIGVIKKTLEVSKKQTTWKDVLVHKETLSGSSVVYSRSRGFQKEGIVSLTETSPTNPKGGFIYTNIPNHEEIYLHNIGVPDEWMIQKTKDGFVCVTTIDYGVMIRFIFKQNKR